MGLSCVTLIQIQLSPVGSEAPKAKVMFKGTSVAVVDSERWLEDLK